MINPFDGRAGARLRRRLRARDLRTGAIMAVPGEDERDYEFAQVHGLPVVRTVEALINDEGRRNSGDGGHINGLSERLRRATR